ncbi:sensor histidine kinase [Coleofasciculus sp.]|uniref:sensor histidine kinase n=1 Tax=Coleofasciculus sp. TaxID=3100458 RepID=UPI003A120CB5
MADDIHHIFAAFYRGKNIDSIPGSGLGLTVAKTCVIVHGGNISVTSEPGVGTTFTVTERYQALMAFITFFFFGLSDIIEVQTGAWWRPWWLLVWKSLCVFSMGALLINYLRSRSDSR